jgi:predicted nucleotidyltransferase
MERYLPPGSHSCKPARSPLEAAAALRRVAQQSVLQNLTAALGASELYLVGGTVRDAFYDTSDTDLDLATNLSAADEV